MNRRGFFSLLAGASVAALAPALLARPDYTKGQVFTFHPAAANTGPITMQLDGGPLRVVVQYRERGSSEWRKVPPVHYRDLRPGMDLRLLLA